MDNNLFEVRGMGINGEWFYGNLSILKKKLNNVPAGYYISNSAGSPFAYNVRPETVGRTLGLKDENCRTIFDGDIVCANIREIHAQNIQFKGDNKQILFKVSWDLCQWSFEILNKNDVRYIAYTDIENIIIVGNIYQNKELLKRG